MLSDDMTNTLRQTFTNPLSFTISLLICALVLTFATAQAQKPEAKGETTVDQVPRHLLLRIIMAEDKRLWDNDLSGFLSDGNAGVRGRAALAAGRIGDERAVPALISLLQKDNADGVRAMAAFALGETESASAAEALVDELSPARAQGELRARIMEALGKITAALPKSEEERARSLGAAILSMLNFEHQFRTDPDRQIVLLGLTAVLRARPEGAGKVIAQFLSSADPRVRSDAANALARLRVKDGNDQLRKLLTTDPDPTVRANAARVLGATEDKDAFKGLLDRALKDTDSRVRVSAIRALGTLKERNDDVDTLLLERGMRILEKNSSLALHKNELLEIASTLGSRLTKKQDKVATSWLREVRVALKFESPEVEVALARLDPAEYVNDAAKFFLHYNPSTIAETVKGKQLYISEEWRHLSSLARGLGEVAQLIPKEDKEGARVRAEAQDTLLRAIGEKNSLTFYDDIDVPEVMRAYAAFKPEELRTFLHFQLGLESTTDTPTNNKSKRVLVASDDLRIKGRYAGSKYLTPPDVIISATAAELLAELPANENSTRWLVESLHFSLQEATNDAALAILDALATQKSPVANDAIKTALDSSDHLIRRRAVALLKANGVGEFSNRIGTVKTRYTEADYRRAIERIGRQIRATVETSKGSFTIELLPDDAPLNVDNFVQLAKRGYFKDTKFHRVVPNFVIQGGDPRGDGNGGPGYQIRCEINEAPFERGAVGMALSGKDTGGSQWFVTHSPQPHLDGGYTVFGNVVTGMSVVDSIARGDVIRSLVITEGRRVLTEGGRRSAKRKA